MLLCAKSDVWRLLIKFGQIFMGTAKDTSLRHIPLLHFKSLLQNMAVLDLLNKTVLSLLLKKYKQNLVLSNG